MRRGARDALLPRSPSGASSIDTPSDRPTSLDVAYPRIEDHGVVGDLRTVALVCNDGTVDWFCTPRVDSPSVFAAILDDKKGGWFRIRPTSERVQGKQLYWPDTNVLITRFLSPDGVGEIEDFMPIGDRREAPGTLVRRVRVVRGSVGFALECRPAFDYARAGHRAWPSPGGVIFEGPGLSLALSASVPLTIDGDAARAEFALDEGQSCAFVLRPCEENVCHICGVDEAEQLFADTVAWWRRWLRASTYRGRWREMVNRSALVLKLLTYEPTGAIVAAPTCSLCEMPGGVRNWDYRYTWIRDAAFTLYGLMRLGFTSEAGTFMQWLAARCREADPAEGLQIVYGIDGRARLEEETLDHLDGYRSSRPVRIGNGAYLQLQLDIYGELLDAVYLHNKYGEPISYDLWCALRKLIDWLGQNWQREDEGIWEVRSGRRHFVYSKLMCWVAFDRAIRLAEKRSFPADRARWYAIRDHIYEEVIARGWSESRQAFMQSFGSSSLDASNLIMPLVFFCSPTDPKMLQTIEATMRGPRQGGLTSDGLVYRYDADRPPDGIAGGEGTFNLCTFWLVEALTRAGRLDEARLIFERMLGYANHLGLYAEQTGPAGEALGNFPQGFTHIALISAAYNLDRRLDARR